MLAVRWPPVCGASHVLRQLLLALVWVWLLNGSEGQTCVNPTTPQAGFVYTAGGVNCSNLTAGSINCSAQPSCAAGYIGNPQSSDHACPVDDAELTLGGCVVACVVPPVRPGYIIGEWPRLNLPVLGLLTLGLPPLVRTALL